MLFLSVRGFLDYAGPSNPLAIIVVAVLPSSIPERSQHPVPSAFRSSIARPTNTSVYASSGASRRRLQDSRPGWIRCSFPVGLFHPLQHAGLSRRSPDSRFIGFFSGGKLKTIEASGGTPVELCDASSGRGGTWNREGVILFTPTVVSPLQRVSAAGGTASPVTSVDTSKNETSHRWPHFLPDGRHFL